MNNSIGFVGWPALVTLTGEESESFLGRAKKAKKTKTQKRKSILSLVKKAAFVAIAPAAAIPYYSLKAVQKRNIAKKKAEKKRIRTQAITAAKTAQQNKAVSAPGSGPTAAPAAAPGSGPTAAPAAAPGSGPTTAPAEIYEDIAPQETDQEQQEPEQEQQPEEQQEPEQEQQQEQEQESDQEQTESAGLSSFHQRPLIIKRPEALGFAELSTDEQLAKKIFEATGDKVFKGFLPLSWNTKYITQMRDVYETLKAKGPITPLSMAMKIPSVSIKAHEYFIKNKDKISGWLDKPEDILKPVKPLLWIAGLGVGAYFLAQLVPLLKKRG